MFFSKEKVRVQFLIVINWAKLAFFLDTNFQGQTAAEWKAPWNWAFAAAKRLVENGVKFVVKSSGHFRALFNEERGAAKFHQKFHGIFHGNFHARSQTAALLHALQKWQLGPVSNH